MDACVSSLSLEEPSSPSETSFVDGAGVGSATSSKDTSKRKRITQACDLCRKKKTKCDVDLVKLTCTTCTLAGVHCTFEKTRKKRGPPKGWQRQASGSENEPAMPRQQSDPTNQVSHSRAHVGSQKRVNSLQEMHDGALLPPSSVATPSPLSSSFPASSPSSNPSIETHDRLVPMTLDVARHLSTVYFSTTHYSVPIVDEEVFTASLMEMGLAELPGILYCAVFMVACGHLAPNDTILASELSLSSLQLHDRILGNLPAFGSDLDSLRAFLLLAHHDYLYSKGALFSQGVVLRQRALDIAFHLGLHHSPDPRQYSLRESELRKRIWWACYMSDISMGFATGCPVRIDDDECNVDLPIDVDTESFHGERISSQQIGVGSNPLLYQIFRQYAKLVRSLNRIVRHVYQDEALFEAIHAQRREAIIQRLDWELGVWKSELPSYMSFNLETPWNSIMEEQLQQLGPLMVVFYGSILLLYRPMLRLIDNVNEMDEGLRRCAQRCYNSATILVNIVDKLDLAAFRRFSWKFPGNSIFQACLVLAFLSMKRSDNEIEDYLQRGVRALDRISSFHPSLFPILRDFILGVKGPGVMSNMAVSENNGTSTNGNYLNSTDTMSSVPHRPEQTSQHIPSSRWSHKGNDTFPALSPMTYPFPQTSISSSPDALPADSSMPNCFVAEPSQLFDPQPMNPMTSFPVLPEQTSIATPDLTTLAYWMGLPSPFPQIDDNGAECDSYF